RAHEVSGDSLSSRLGPLVSANSRDLLDCLIQIERALKLRDGWQCLVVSSPVRERRGQLFDAERRRGLTQRANRVSGSNETVGPAGHQPRDPPGPPLPQPPLPPDPGAPGPQKPPPEP